MLGWCKLLPVRLADNIVSEIIIDSLYSMGEKGSVQAKLEAKTWPVLKHLAQTIPEACIQFQGNIMPHLIFERGIS